MAVPGSPTPLARSIPMDRMNARKVRELALVLLLCTARQQSSGAPCPVTLSILALAAEGVDS